MRIVSLVLLLSLFTCTTVLAQDRLEKNSELQGIIDIFDSLELPNVAGKKPVLYNYRAYVTSGPKDEFTLSWYCAAGWLLSESDKEITIFLSTLETRTYARKHDLPPRWYKIKHKHPKGMPLPGYYKEVDFGDLCKKYLQTGRAEKKSALDYFTRAGGLHLGGVRAALFAYWAHQRGMEKTALELVELAKQLEEKSIPSWKRKGLDISRRLLDSVATGAAANLRWRTVSATYRGLPRPELVKKWKIIAELPANKFTEEATEMVVLYEKMIAEDKEWKEPSGEELAKMKPAEKARYWIHKLHAAAASQTKYPGYCHVLMHHGYRQGEPNPARDLFKLGWDAIPVLIEHFHDPRLTRSVGGEWSQYLLRYGQCCQQIFETMTGLRLYKESSYVLRDWKKPECVKKAQEWWSEHKSEGAEKFYFKVLETALADKHELEYRESLRMELAIDSLLRTDRKKYLPKILAIAGEDHRAKYKLLRVIGPHLGKRQQNWLESFLEFEKLWAVYVAAKTLWEQCEADVGAKKIVEILRSSAEAQEDRSFCATAISLVLAQVQKDFVVDAICEFTKHKSHVLKSETIQKASRFHHEHVLESLITLLEDKGCAPWENEHRYCDSAAFSISKMVGYPGKFKLYSPIEERDAAIAELKSWLNENKEGMDWEALRRYAQERRKTEQAHDK